MQNRIVTCGENETMIPKRDKKAQQTKPVRRQPNTINQCLISVLTYIAQIKVKCFQITTACGNERLTSKEIEE